MQNALTWNQISCMTFCVMLFYYMYILQCMSILVVAIIIIIIIIIIKKAILRKMRWFVVNLPPLVDKWTVWITGVKKTGSPLFTVVIDCSVTWVLLLSSLYQCNTVFILLAFPMRCLFKGGFYFKITFLHKSLTSITMNYMLCKTEKCFCCDRIIVCLDDVD